MYKIILLIAVLATLAAAGCGSKPSDPVIPEGMKVNTMTQSQMAAVNAHMQQLHNHRPQSSQ